ncbi:AAA family ATPase [Candidatus Symbiobacter mobilis]|uniref:ATPase-like protein n=1 Tax=Candidatus Symbiobacter mobilis CR TaxID=946483 RepID=U5NB90_9BURK|nr:ATP-binding protein [Candidatus Symbiobacter mobilis]AGX87434.1 ATPase-like protein [Candidatus Symbiobacter mobilis CR]
MLVTRIKLKNWRNFREVDIPLGPRAYLIGANASGKSNLLDVFRFLRTLAQTDGGGLQKAIKERGGLGKIRSLHARKDPGVRIEVEMTDSTPDQPTAWRYVLAIKSESTGLHRALVLHESVECNGKEVFTRPNPEDQADPDRLTQTHLEQINNNASFRPLVEHLSGTTYLHLVPQLLKFSDEIGSRMLESDPFGQGLMQRIAKTPTKTRDARLRRISSTLAKAVPLFSALRFEQDAVTGLWHLAANFSHWRGHGAWQKEDQLSDGTLRLIGLLWALQEGDGLLLLEEPELSLNDGIVAHIPLMIDRILRDRKKRLSPRQVLVSTHSAVLLTEVADPQAMLLIEPGANGSTIRVPDPDESNAMAHGLHPSEVLLPKTRPQALEQLGLFA